MIQDEERESDDGDQLQGGPFPARYHSHGRALVFNNVRTFYQWIRETPGFFHTPPNLVVERVSRSSKAARGEDL